MSKYVRKTHDEWAVMVKYELGWFLASQRVHKGLAGYDAERQKEKNPFAKYKILKKRINNI